VTQVTSPYVLTAVVCQQPSEDGYFNGYATYFKNEKDCWVRLDR
jgi:hypothetical protein